MKDIDQIRRENMATLEQEAGGVTAAADRAGMSQSQWSNLRAGAVDSKTGKSRGMRKETARKIEITAGKPTGWLDLDHGLLSPSSYTQTPSNHAESAGEQRSIDGLMAQITPILDSAPKTLRNAVLLLAMKYEKDPAEGERIAAAIRALVGAPDDPGT